MRLMAWLKNQLHPNPAVPVDLEKLGAQRELEYMQREIHRLETERTYRRLKAEADVITRRGRNYHDD